MITTGSYITQPIVYTIPVGTPTGYTLDRLGLYVTQGGKTTRYPANAFSDCSPISTGSIIVNGNIVALSVEGSYRLEFRAESESNVDITGTSTIPIASNIIRKVVDANTTTVRI